MTRHELNEALEAVTYYAKADRLQDIRDTLATLAEQAAGTGTAQGRDALRGMVEDYRLEVAN